MKFKNFLDSIPEKRRKAIAKWTNRVLLAGVFTYLIVQISSLDWREALREIPTNPLFYLIFLGIYFGLPIAESFIYRILWKVPFKKIFPELIKKRVYNKDVLNYSGEAHLFAWAREHVDRTDKQLLLDMKDNTIISSLTSMSVAFSLLTLFLFTGFLPFDALFQGGVSQNWVIGGVLCAILLVLLALRFRRSVISIPGSMAAALFGIHVSRLLIVQGLQILQWIVGMPEAAIEIWFVYLSAQIVANQIPLIPSKDALVLAISKDISQQLKVSEAAIFSMLGITLLLDKLVNVILFAYLSSRKKPTNDLPSTDSWNKENHLIKKSLRAIGITFLVYAVLVATHLGEFWPFSIYPMFSQAGNPWSRAIVLDVTDSASELSWQSVNEAGLPGPAVAVPDYGVDPIDLANFVSKTEKWDQARISGLRSMFKADELEGRSLLVMRARGEMNEQDSVRVYFEPYVVLNNTGAILNPDLPR